jgi:hypothetical protein
MFELKALSKEAVPRALEKAERYRLLNEPAEAESICLDILAVEPGNQQALVVLLLARTDQFEESENLAGAREVLARLRDEYSRAYYAGIIHERRAKAQLRRGHPGSGHIAYEAIQEALRAFETAETLRPAGNDDALLRWNACVRLLESRPNLGPAPQERFEAPLE